MKLRQTLTGTHSSWQNPLKGREFILLSVLLLPVFFINVKPSHSWGGDFALYILQARNLVEGKPQTATGYIFNEQGLLPSPQTYPMGFPLLLAPLYYFFGNNILVFSYFISLVLFVLGLALYYFFRMQFSRWSAAIAVLIIIFNPWTLDFKAEILSDLPFMFFMMLSVIFYLRLNPDRRAFPESVWLGFLMAAAMLMKSIGVLLLFSMLADFVLRLVKKTFVRENKISGAGAMNLLVASASALLFYAGVAFVLVPTAQEPLPYYQSLYNFHDPLNLIWNALQNYVREFQGFFHNTGSGWKIVTLSTIGLASLIMAVGLIRKFIKTPAMPEFLTTFYFFIILSFPTANQGFRYIFPILPICIYFVIFGAQSFRFGTKNYSNHLLTLLAVLCLLHYPAGIQRILRDQNKMTAGPQEGQSQDAFRYIRENTSRKAVIAFIKATIVPLYTRRKCIANRRDQDVASMALKFEQVGVDYYLTHSDLSNIALDKFLAEYHRHIKLVWYNTKFKLYKRID